MANRLRGRYGYPADDPFQVTFHPDKLDVPAKWKKPRLIFVCSMGDLFHEDVHNEYLYKIFLAMRAANWHYYLLLTKRPERAKKYLTLMNRIHGLPSNVGIGVTVESDKHLDRIETLLQIPAAMRFVSAEPLLGPVDVDKYLQCKSCLDRKVHWCGDPVINWIIAGGESGPGARPMHPDWARALRDQCQAAGVAYHFKQWGAWNEPLSSRAAYKKSDEVGVIHVGGKQWPKSWMNRIPRDGDCIIIKVGKKRAGRLLDGREWNEYPPQIISHFEEVKP